MTSSGFLPLHLNERGQCSHCCRKPIPYKRTKYWFCPICDRAFSMETGEQITNFSWIKQEDGSFLPRVPDTRRAARVTIREFPDVLS